MRIVETPTFTKVLLSALSDDSYSALQAALALRPQQGNIIPGTGGLRKLRWAGKGHGKSGGFRIIYYWDKPSETIFMLYLYSKNRQEDLTEKQLKVLAKLVREELK